ncbi:MAG: potassium transporter TrkG, partial [Pseudomonadota bacterium]
MIDVRPVLFLAGIVVSVMAAAMVLPALVDFLAGDPDWIVFAASSGVCMFVGLSLAFANQGASLRRLALREMFLMTTAAWLFTAAAAALPFAFANFPPLEPGGPPLRMSYTDAFFEAMSGITTTGATVMTRLEEAPPGILLWRALLQWLGGVGIIVMGL